MQAYALYKYLESQGHDVEIIDLLRPVHDRFIYDSCYKPYRSTRFTLKTDCAKLPKNYLDARTGKVMHPKFPKNVLQNFSKTSNTPKSTAR